MALSSGAGDVRAPLKLIHLAPLGLLALFLARAREDLAFVAFGVMALTGLALAVKFRPSIAGIVRERRLPARAEWADLSIGLVIAYLAFGTVDQLFVIAITRRYTSSGTSRLVQLVSDLLLVAWLLLAIAPGAAQIARRRTASPGSGPAAGGLAASVFLGLPVFMVWELVGKDLLAGGAHSPWRLGLLMLVPVVGLLWGFGGLVWWRAVAGSPGARPLFGGAFAVAVRAAALGWLAVAALAVLDLSLTGFSPGGGRLEFGSTLALVWTVLIAGVWLGALVKLRAVSAANPWRAGGAVGALLVCFLISGFPAFTLQAAVHSQIGDAGLLTALLMLPVFVLLIAACLWPAPYLVRRIAG